MRSSVKAAVISLREQHPDWEVLEIAATVGVSRHWASEILRAANLTRRYRRCHHQSETTTRVIALREQHPDWLMREVAAEVRVSPERVRQILKAAGVRTQAYRPPQTVERANEGCANRCLKPERDNARTYCSVECRKAVSWVAVRCSYCGAEKTVLWSHYNRAMGLTGSRGGYKGRFFCDRTCSGAYAGKNYGWGQYQLGLNAAITDQGVIAWRTAAISRSRAAMLRRLQNYIVKLEGEIAKLREASPELGDSVGALEEENTRLKELVAFYCNGSLRDSDQGQVSGPGGAGARKVSDA
jgi:hypothetical protein